MRKPLLLLLLPLVLLAACRSASVQNFEVAPANTYKRAILDNQECYRNFDRIDRLETITVINRDREGNVKRYHREELNRGIVRLANDRSSLLGVTVHPFFSARDTFSVVGTRDSTVLVRVESAASNVRHYLNNIVLEVSAEDRKIDRLTADVLIHGYGREGHSVHSEKLVSDWERENGCDLPRNIRLHPTIDSTLQRPRLTIENEYRFAGSQMQDI